MNKKFLNLVGVITVITALASCVPARQYDEMKMRKATCDEENSKLRSENTNYSTQNKELTSSVADLRREKEKLETDTTTLGTAQRRLTSLYNELNDSYEKLLRNNDRMMKDKNDETKKVIGQLQMTQDELIKKQDELTAKEKKLNELTEELKKRESKVNELEAILNKKDEDVNALRKAVSDALVGFENNGLTITKKNGKVYVSMEEKLLFASGSTVVDKKGEEALKELGKVLEKNKDINVLIEGHTDNVPISGGTMKDNWDLSVLRATSVVRILTKNANIDPTRLTPAGRGPYLPVDTGNTAEARRKNRRIEIILTPKLDELFKVIGEN